MQQQQMINPGVGGVPPGSAIVFNNNNMPVPIRSRTYDRFQDNQSKILGVTLIIIGILCIIFNGVAIGMADDSYESSAMVAYVGHGIWCGILFIITGGFGIGAGVKKTKCQIITFMVLCIISAMTTITLLTLGIIGACAAAEDCVYNYDYGYGYTYPYYRAPCVKMNDYEVIVSMESMMAILGLLAGICAIWGSALCCGSGVCCCRTHSTPVIAQRPGYTCNFQNGGQILYLNQMQSGQNYYLQQQQQSMYPYTQGMMPPPYVATYAQQSGWAMPPPTESNDPLIGQAPPQYPAVLQVTSAQGQPTNQGKFY